MYQYVPPAIGSFSSILSWVMIVSSAAMFPPCSGGVPDAALAYFKSEMA